MTQFKIDLSGSGGLAQSYSKIASNLNYLANDNDITQGSYNPFVYPGYLTPARNIKKVLTQLDLTIVDWACQFDVSTKKFITGGSLISTGNMAFNIYTDLGTFTAATGLDLGVVGSIYNFAVYQLNGVRTLFFTSFAGGSGYIGVHNFVYTQYNWSSGNTNANLYTGSVVGSGTFSSPPFLRVASNSYMYALVGNAIHKIDGTTTGGTAGTITANVLVLDANYKISDAVDWRNNMYIAITDTQNYGFDNLTPSYKTSTVCGVFVWDRVSTQLGNRDFIPLYGIQSINRIFVAHDGKLRMICVTSSGYTQLREYNGSSFEILYEIGIGTAPYLWDSTTFSDYATFWLGQDNNIYAHGKPIGTTKNSLYKLGSISSNASVGRNFGYLFYGNNNAEISGGLFPEALFYNIGNNASTSAVTSKVLFNAITTPTGFTSSLPGTADATVIKNKITQMPYLCTVNEIKVMFATVTSSGVGDETDVVGNIKIYFNQGTTAFKSQNITKKDTRKGYVTIPLHKTFVNTIQVGIDYSGVTSVGNISGIVNDMMPWYALVDYTNTQARQ